MALPSGPPMERRTTARRRSSYGVFGFPDILGGRYEGLPFVPPRLKSSFLSRMEEDPDGNGHFFRGYFEEYFNAQERIFHSLLEMIFHVHLHLEYWLDWTTEVRRRPEWLYGFARQVALVSLIVMGRGVQATNPGMVVGHLRCLGVSLSRLVARSQQQAFQVLDSDATGMELVQTVDKRVRRQLREMRALGLERLAASSDPRRHCESTAQVHGDDSPITSEPDEDEEEEDEVPEISSSPHEPEEGRRTRNSPSRKDGDVEGLRSGPLNRPKAQTAFEMIQDTVFPVKTPLRVRVQHTPEEFLTRRYRLQVLCDQEGEMKLHLRRHLGHIGKLSHLEFYGPMYGAGLLVGFGYCLVKLKTTDRAARGEFYGKVVGASRQFLREWISEPYGSFVEELTNHVRQDEILSVPLQELRDHQEQLDRMVEHFSALIQGDPTSTVDFSKPCVEDQYWENSLGTPLASVYSGHLMESCMVQAQRMKVLMMASMYSVDSVIAQLKWDFLMAGIMPMVTLTGLLYYTFASFRQRGRHQAQRQIIRALGNLQRNFIRQSDYRIVPESPTESSVGPRLNRDFSMGSVSEHLHAHGMPHRHDRGRTGTSDEGDDKYQQAGQSLVYLDALYRLAFLSWLDSSDWRSFKRDILDLAHPRLSAMQKAQLVSTMRFTYPIFYTS